MLDRDLSASCSPVLRDKDEGSLPFRDKDGGAQGGLARLVCGAGHAADVFTACELLGLGTSCGLSC